MGIIDAATNAVGTGATVLSNAGPATGLSSITDAVSGGISSAGTFLQNLAGVSAGVKLPLANVLSDYATYNYILSLSALTLEDINNPDSTYIAGKKLDLICKSAGIDPNNRVQTSFGKFDFFIDNLNIESVIGMSNPKGSFATTLQFDVVEPYSMGVFMLALQQAAFKAGHGNWRDATFLITVEFRGNKEDGTMSKPTATRYIPVRLTTVAIKASEQGTIYNFSAYAAQNQALTSQYADVRIDSSIKGKTVQEVLQTGEQSLQEVVNKKLKEYETKGLVAKADEIIILFPTTIASSASQGIASAPESASSATTTPGSDAASIYKKLGVATPNTNHTAVQAESDCNFLGKASMGYDQSRKGDQTTCKESDSYAAGSGIWVRGNMTVNVNEGSLRFAQGADVLTIINRVMMLSKHPETALAVTALDADGMRKWWRIDTQVFYVNSPENLKKTGVLPRIIVYRVIPYDTHSSAIAASNASGIGFDNVRAKIVKRYDYLYTGKNSEVLKFDIDFSINFSNVLAADNYKRSIDILRNKETGDKNLPAQSIEAPSNGVSPQKKEGSNTTQQKYTSFGTLWNWVGGGGKDVEATLAAAIWHKAITNPIDMINLNMDIMGDPYWFAQSGQGNYTSAPYPGVKDLNKDGTVNYQSGEVDILVNFRSPLDINQATGLYDFKSSSTSSSSASVIGWSGLYRVNMVTNTFRAGVFKQTLKGFRRRLEDPTVIGTPDQQYNASNSPEKKQ